jgi:hypothetical protein
VVVGCGSNSLLTTKVTTNSGDGWPNVGICTEEEPNCGSRGMPLKHQVQGVPHLWQARGPGFESPMLHYFPLNSRLAVNVSECQFLA